MTFHIKAFWLIPWKKPGKLWGIREDFQKFQEIKEILEEITIELVATKSKKDVFHHESKRKRSNTTSPLLLADVSPCAGQQTHQAKWYVASPALVFHCCWLSLWLTEGVQPHKVSQCCTFFLFFLQAWKPLFYSTRHYHAVTPPTRHSAAQKWPTSFHFFIFPPHLHRPSAHTSRGAINPFQLWPLDMLTVDDLCWCRCYVKSAPLRPHSAGAHLGCTQAGKTHREALLSSLTTLLSCILLP